MLQVNRASFVMDPYSLPFRAQILCCDGSLSWIFDNKADGLEEIAALHDAGKMTDDERAVLEELLKGIPYPETPEDAEAIAAEYGGVEIDPFASDDEQPATTPISSATHP